MRPHLRHALAGLTIGAATLAPLAIGYGLYASAQPPSSALPSVHVELLRVAPTPSASIDFFVQDRRIVGAHVALAAPVTDGWTLKLVTFHVTRIKPIPISDHGEADLTVEQVERNGIAAVWVLHASGELRQWNMELGLDAPVIKAAAGETVGAYPDVRWTLPDDSPGHADVEIRGADGVGVDLSAAGVARAPTQSEARSFGTVGLVERVPRSADERSPSWEPGCRTSGTCASAGTFRYIDTRARQRAQTRLLWSGIAFGLWGNAIVGLSALTARRLWRRAHAPRAAGSPTTAATHHLAGPVGGRRRYRSSLGS